jgi:hypothetical protein
VPATAPKAVARPVRVTPLVTPAVPPSASLDAAAYIAAVGLAAVAAWFSIRGMAVLFPGAPLSAVAMALAMETAKLATAGWLAGRWRVTA